MAVQKSKTSKQRTNTRFANFKAPKATLVECPQCHELKKNHMVCANCGYYDGEKKIKVASDEKK